MDYSDDELRLAAKARIARVFNVSPDALSLDAVFGDDLKASFVSTWKDVLTYKDNELDEILYDIRDVANRQTLKKLNNGDLVIRTVGDYCEFMVSGYRTKPKLVIEILFGGK